MGIDPDKFWSYTWKENQLLGEAHSIKQNLEWERTRYLATMIHNVNCQKKTHMKKPEDLLRLPQDEMREIEKAKPKSSPEQLQAFLDKIEKMKGE